MNERIKELYKQAHSIRYHDGDPMRDGNPPTVYWEGEVSAAKFAELIVQECADWAARCVVMDKAQLPQDPHSVGWNSGVAYASREIKKHFGIEE